MNRKLNGWKDRRAYRTSVYVIHDRTIDRIDRVIRMCTRKKIRKKQVRKSLLLVEFYTYHITTHSTLYLPGNVFVPFLHFTLTSSDEKYFGQVRRN